MFDLDGSMLEKEVGCWPLASLGMNGFMLSADGLERPPAGLAVVIGPRVNMVGSVRKMVGNSFDTVALVPLGGSICPVATVGSVRKIVGNSIGTVALVALGDSICAVAIVGSARNSFGIVSLVAYP